MTWAVETKTDKTLDIILTSTAEIRDIEQKCMSALAQSDKLSRGLMDEVDSRLSTLETRIESLSHCGELSPDARSTATSIKQMLETIRKSMDRRLFY